MDHSMKFIAVAAGAAFFAASAPAFAGNINLATVDTAGTASTGSGGLVLTTVGSDFAAGAGYENQTFALGAGANFDETFTFTIAAPATGPTANGFAFFLESSTAGLASSNTNLGLTSSSPLAVEFYDFGNKTLNPAIPNTSPQLYDSNLVAAIQGGSTQVAGNSPASYGSPNNVLSCTGKTPGADCMNNGDVWSVNLQYLNGKLYVTLTDTTANSGPFLVIDGYAIALAPGQYYTGFSGSTGGSSDGVTITSWSQDVPEPMSMGLFGAGLAALGLVKARRRAV
jgi:hypothetical protein